MGRTAAALLVASTAALAGAIAWGALSDWSPAYGLLAVPLVANAALAVVLRRMHRQSNALERERQRLAGLDPVTQVAARATFELALADTLTSIGDPTRGRRAGDATGDMALIVLEVAGVADDGVLRAVARLLGQTVRPDDTLARVGGSEFAVIAPGAGSTGARRLAEALRIACARVNGADGEPLAADTAFALHPSDGMTAKALLEVADDRLLVAKRGSGRRPAPKGALVARPGPA